MATAPGYADVSCRMVLSTYNRPAYVTFGVDPLSTDPDAIAASISTAWFSAGSINTRLDSNVTMTEVTVRLGTDGGEDLVGSAISTTPGARAGSSPTPNVAVLYYKRTSRGGRRGRGRFYLPWYIGTGDLGEDGVITPSIVTALQTVGTTFLAALTTNAVPMVLLHSPGQTIEGPPNEVNSLVVSNVVATQRRRLTRS